MQTTTRTTIDLDLEMPPSGGDLATTTLEDEAQALRVLLDKSENFKVAVGQRLLDLLNNHFGGNRNALRDWYEDKVVEGKAHRAWHSVETYLGVVRTHGERAGEIFAERDERELLRLRQRHERDRELRTRGLIGADENNNNNQLQEAPRSNLKSEYDQRKQWLAQMDHLWFSGQSEWQKKWLSDRGLKSTGQL